MKQFSIQLHIQAVLLIFACGFIGTTAEAGEGGWCMIPPIFTATALNRINKERILRLVLLGDVPMSLNESIEEDAMKRVKIEIGRVESWEWFPASLFQPKVVPMNKQKPAPGGGANKKAEDSLVRSSAAKYLTFVAASGQGGVEAVYVDENVWLSQKMMGVLYDVETHTVNYHRKKIFDDAELEAGSVIRNFRITAADGKSYDTRHYNLSAILAVGYQVNSERVVQFRGELFYGTQILVCFLFLAKIKAAGKCRAVPELELALAA